MKKRKGSALCGLLLVVVAVAILFMPVIGYVKNVIGFTQCDFKAPIKAEVIRATGIVFPPVGMIAGFCEIKDGVQK
jgi:hypothetical protein